MLPKEVTLVGVEEKKRKKGEQSRQDSAVCI